MAHRFFHLAPGLQSSLTRTASHISACAYLFTYFNLKEDLVILGSRGSISLSWAKNSSEQSGHRILWLTAHLRPDLPAGSGFPLATAPPTSQPPQHFPHLFPLSPALKSSLSRDYKVQTRRWNYGFGMIKLRWDSPNSFLFAIINQPSLYKTEKLKRKMRKRSSASVTGC